MVIDVKTNRARAIEKSPPGMAGYTDFPRHFVYHEAFLIMYPDYHLHNAPES